MTTHNNLRKYRLEKGMTQMDVARHLGLASSDRISEWENGLAYPHVRHFVRLLRLFDVRGEDVYESESL